MHMIQEVNQQGYIFSRPCGLALEFCRALVINNKTGATLNKGKSKNFQYPLAEVVWHVDKSHWLILISTDILGKLNCVQMSQLIDKFQIR